MIEMVLAYSLNEMERVLQRPVSWDAKENGPVRLSQYISTKLPQVAGSLGLDYVKNGESVKSIDELTEEERRKLTLAILEEGGQKNWSLLVGRRDYSYQELVDGIKNNNGFGPRGVEMAIQETSFLLALVEAGKLRIDPDKPDVDFSYPPRLTEFP